MSATVDMSALGNFNILCSYSDTKGFPFGRRQNLSALPRKREALDRTKHKNSHSFKTNTFFVLFCQTMATKPSNWSGADDEKLFVLFRKGTRNGGCSPTDLSKPNIEAVRARFFPERTYRNFSVQYRKKSSIFNINQAVSGGKHHHVMLLPYHLRSHCLTCPFLIIFKHARRAPRKRKLRNPKNLPRTKTTTKRTTTVIPSQQPPRKKASTTRLKTISPKILLKISPR